MSYFHGISLCLGVILALGGFWFLAAPVSYRNLALSVLPGKRPAWFLVSALAMLLWVLYTWKRFFEAPDAMAAAVSFVLSLTLIKAYFFTFHYPAFRDFALKFVGMDVAILKVIGLIYIASAAAFLALGVSS